MTDRPEHDRNAAIARAKALAAARSEASESLGDLPPAAPPAAPNARVLPTNAARPRATGPSPGRILAAAGATAAGVGLVGAMALGAQSGAAAAEPTQPAPAPVTEYRTVVIQVPAGTQAGDPLVGTAVSAVATEQPLPAPAAADRTPVTQTEGS